MQEAEASDLHLVSGYRPMYRVHGDLKPADEAIVSSEDIRSVLQRLAPEAVRPRLDNSTDVDFAIQLDFNGTPHRFRVNAFSSRGSRGACFRAIASKIPTLAELTFPSDVAERILAMHQGLVLITGVTGSGKTSTLAALIGQLNTRGGFRIITIEEPVEFIYPPAPTSVVTQREVGVDVASFYDGLRFGLRQDPDVILVGEIRDRETAQLAMSAAETGHVIFATLHTADTKGAITRMIDLFPSEMHDDVRSQLSLSLRAVVAQHLLPGDIGKRRVLAIEALFASFAVRSAIRQGKIEGIDTAIQSGAKEGMVSLDRYLRSLVDVGRIPLETARMYAKDPTEF
jgi:twitching motility protein PilT